MTPEAHEVPRDQLLAGLKRIGVVVTPSQLRRWTDAGLLPSPRRQGLGRGRGTTSFYPTIVFLQIPALHHALKQSRSLDEAGWLLWVLGFDVTPFVRELLEFEWRKREHHARATLRALKDKRGRAKIEAELRSERDPAVRSLLTVVPKEHVLEFLTMWSEFELGSLDTSTHDDSAYERLQWGTLALLAPDEPELIDDDDLPAVAEVQAGLEQQGREQTPKKLIRALRMLDDDSLIIARDEAQALFARLAGAIGHDDAIMPRDVFRRYFAHSIVDARGAAEWEQLYAAMGWSETPLSPIAAWHRDMASATTREITEK